MFYVRRPEYDLKKVEKVGTSVDSYVKCIF